MKRLTIKGNSKMGPDVGIWNLPPVLTCKPSVWCLEHCYARRNNFLLPSVLRSLAWRLEQSQLPKFIPQMIAEAQHFEFFRIHASGDFYSKEYIVAWSKIIQGCPNTKFRTTTRRDDFTELLKALHKLPNMIVRESLDPTRRWPHMGLPVAAIRGLPAAKGGLRCPDDCLTCNYRCWRRAVNVQFEEF
jgi:hypothetical protein